MLANLLTPAVYLPFLLAIAVTAAIIGFNVWPDRRDWQTIRASLTPSIASGPDGVTASIGAYAVTAADANTARSLLLHYLKGEHVAGRFKG